jgi:hypothetical protein
MIQACESVYYSIRSFKYLYEDFSLNHSDQISSTHLQYPIILSFSFEITHKAMAGYRLCLRTRGDMESLQVKFEGRVIQIEKNKVGREDLSEDSCRHSWSGSTGSHGGCESCMQGSPKGTDDEWDPQEEALVWDEESDNGYSPLGSLLGNTRHERPQPSGFSGSQVSLNNAFSSYISSGHVSRSGSNGSLMAVERSSRLRKFAAIYRIEYEFAGLHEPLEPSEFQVINKTFLATVHENMSYEEFYSAFNAPFPDDSDFWVGGMTFLGLSISFPSFPTFATAYDPYDDQLTPHPVPPMIMDSVAVSTCNMEAVLYLLKHRHAQLTIHLRCSLES